MMRLCALAVGILLAGAAVSATVTARSAYRVYWAIEHHLPMPDYRGAHRGGDHVWQITVNQVAMLGGRALNPTEARTMAGLLLLVDAEIRAGRAAGRLRALRPGTVTP